MNKSDEAAFVQEVCRQLDASIAHLPKSTVQHLDASRQAAVMQQAHLSSQDDERLANAVGRELDDRSTVSPEIEARLNQIRQSAVARFEALQHERAASVRFSFGAWLKTQFDAFNYATSAGMLATACVLITAISIFYVSSRPAGTLTLEAEIGLVATAEDIELYENLEFYLWLAENESLTL
tara:strand:- start:383 stop:925 length:543 start_codon:yes stop_codon:yes gene_type:complete